MLFRKFRSRVSGRSRHRIMRSRLIFRKLQRRRFSDKSRRRRHKPELKWALRSIASVRIGTNSRYSSYLTPTTMINGNLNGQRIGNSISTFKLSGTLKFYSDGATTGNTLNSDGLIRVIIWTPRVNYTTAENYLNALDFDEPIDYNAATIISDKYMRIGYNRYFVTVDATTFHIPNVYAPIFNKKYRFKWARNTKFLPGNDTFDNETATCFIYIMNPNSFSVWFESGGRMTYIDN